MSPALPHQPSSHHVLPLIGVYLCLSVAMMPFSAGCGRYTNFTLPEMRGGDASLVFRFVAHPEPVIARDEFRDVLNPSVVEMDEEEAGIGEPAVWQSDGFYW